jgi:predicted  nucleic acid-binding Zn-ribbon protein
MDVNFSNVYQEVLFENLDAILKQNFMFQARLKIYETQESKQAELQAKFNELSANYQEAVNKLEENNNSVQTFKVQAQQSDSLNQEKSRIQSALNDSMREITVLNQLIESKDKELSDLKDLLSKKDSDSSKVKKPAVKKVEEKPEETKTQDLFKIEVNDNTF